MDCQPSVLSISLNPAWQKALRFEKLRLGAVNRAYDLVESGGGKGMNFARTCRQLKTKVTVVQLAGGYNGRRLIAELEDLCIPHLTVETAKETRTCTTIIADEERIVTELIEPSAEISNSELDQLHDVLDRNVMRFNAVGICGTFPPGVPPQTYARIVKLAAPHAIVLLDSYKNIEPVLQAGVDIFKINAQELREFTGTNDIFLAAKACMQKYKMTYLAVTAGAQEAFFFTKHGFWRFGLPKLQVQNCIGAGDCTAAVFLSSITREILEIKRTEACVGSSLGSVIRNKLNVERTAELFADALAAASASCLTSIPGVFSVTEAEHLRAKIIIQSQSNNSIR